MKSPKEYCDEVIQRGNRKEMEDVLYSCEVDITHISDVEERDRCKYIITRLRSAVRSIM